MRLQDSIIHYDAKWISRLKQAAYCHPVKEIEAYNFSWSTAIFFLAPFFIPTQTSREKSRVKICNCLNIHSIEIFSRVQISCNLVTMKKKKKWGFLFSLETESMYTLESSCNAHYHSIWVLHRPSHVWVSCLFFHVWNCTSTHNLFFNVCIASINYFYVTPLITQGI